MRDENDVGIVTEAGDGVIADLKAGVTLTDERSFSITTQLTTSAVLKLTFVDISTHTDITHNTRAMGQIRSFLN